MKGDAGERREKCRECNFYCCRGFLEEFGAGREFVDVIKSRGELFVWEGINKIELFFRDFKAVFSCSVHSGGEIVPENFENAEVGCYPVGKVMSEWGREGYRFSVCYLYSS